MQLIGQLFATAQRAADSLIYWLMSERTRPAHADSLLTG